MSFFFGNIRAKNGANNNPTTVQFISAYKKLLLHASVKGMGGNVTIQDDTELQNITKQSYSAYLEDKLKLEEDCLQSILDTDLNDEIIQPLITLGTLSKCQKSIVEYIAGRVVQKVCILIKCTNCTSALSILTSNY